MNPLDQLIRDLTAERFGRPIPPAPKRTPIPASALAELIAELTHQDEDEEVA